MKQNSENLRQFKQTFDDGRWLQAHLACVRLEQLSLASHRFCPLTDAVIMTVEKTINFLLQNNFFSGTKDAKQGKTAPLQPAVHGKPGQLKEDIIKPVKAGATKSGTYCSSQFVK